MKKLIFIIVLLPLFLVAQPKKQGGNQTACSKPNPPSWCSNSAPIDSKLFTSLIILGGVLLVVRNHKKRIIK